MSIQLKAIHEQVILVTGATSDVGMATVRMAVGLGAKVFMVDQNEDELLKIQTEMRLNNLPTAYAVAEVAEIDQVQIAADHCLETFGRIDTWVNIAGAAFYGKLLDTTETEAKRIFDTNFWGVVNGCRIASDLLRMDGGAIINIGNTLSEVSAPLQGIYSASKQAVQSYTDSLRSELSAEQASISVSLVRTTPLGSTKLPDPLYHPGLVSEMIIKCAEYEIKEIELESASSFHSFLSRIQNKMGGKRLSKNQPQELSLTKRVSDHNWIKSGLVVGGLALLFFGRRKYV